MIGTRYARFPTSFSVTVKGRAANQMIRGSITAPFGELLMSTTDAKGWGVLHDIVLVPQWRRAQIKQRQQQRWQPSQLGMSG